MRNAILESGRSVVRPACRLVSSVSQLVTLFLTPVFYTYMDSFQAWLERRFGKMVGMGRPRYVGGPAAADHVPPALVTPDGRWHGTDTVARWWRRDWESHVREVSAYYRHCYGVCMRVKY